MSRIKVERFGGLAGVGLAGSALVCDGEVALADLAPADRRAIDALFATPACASPRQAGPRPDEFRYRITRRGAGGDESVDVAESAVPPVLRGAVRERFA